MELYKEIQVVKRTTQIVSFYPIKKMEKSQVQKLREGFSSGEPLDYRFDILMELFTNFLLDTNEKLKKELGEILYNELDDLSFKFKVKHLALKHKAETLRILGYR